MSDNKDDKPKRPRGRPRKDGLPPGSPKPKKNHVSEKDKMNHVGCEGRENPPLFSGEEGTENETRWNTEQAARAAMEDKINAVDNGDWDFENNRRFNKGGRPKGSKNVKIDPSNAAGKLEELNFDPMVEMIKLYKQINRDLSAVRVKKTDKARNAPTDDPDRYEYTVPRGSHQYNGMLQIKQTIIKDLQRYGYRMVPDKQELDINEKAPTIIKLDLGEKDNNDSDSDSDSDSDGRFSEDETSKKETTINASYEF